MAPHALPLDGDSAVLGRSLDNPHRSINIGAVQIRKLDGSNLPKLRLGHASNVLRVWRSRSLLHASSLLQQYGRRRGLQNKREALILEHSDLDGDDGSDLVLGGRVVLLAERHDVDALGSQSRSDGRGRVCLSGRDGQFDVSSNCRGRMETMHVREGASVWARCNWRWDERKSSLQCADA